MEMSITAEGYENGAERMVRVEFHHGSVGYYEGEKGTERLVQTNNADALAWPRCGIRGILRGRARR